MADNRRANRGLRDEAGVGPDPRQARQLIPLAELDDYQVAEGEPDIRGWNVYTATGREIGDVEDLLVDPELAEVVMMDIDLKRDDRHTLAPIKAVWIDRANRRVVLNTSMFDVDDDIPALRRSGEPVESESVRRFNERYEQAYGADGWDRDRDIDIRRRGENFRITRSVPPPPSELSGRPDAVPVDARSRPDRPVERHVEGVADRSVETTPATEGRGLPRERRRYVRYAPSREGAVVEEVVVRRRVVDPSEMSPSETERLRQEAGDVTRDARDTLTNRPPTEERR